MTDTDCTKRPKGLNLRGGVWHISRSFRGRLVRVSTGCRDLENATEVMRRLERTYISGNLSEWWAHQIKLAKSGNRKSWILQARSRAVSRSANGRPCSLTTEQVIALAEATDGQCPVSGLTFSDAIYGRRRPFIPSLDRIDCDKGYTVANCRFVCVLVNYAMSDFGEGALRIMARSLVAKELTQDCTKSAPTYPQIA